MTCRNSRSWNNRTAMMTFETNILLWLEFINISLHFGSRKPSMQNLYKIYNKKKIISVHITSVSGTTFIWYSRDQMLETPKKKMQNAKGILTQRLTVQKSIRVFISSCYCLLMRPRYKYLVIRKLKTDESEIVYTMDKLLFEETLMLKRIYSLSWSYLIWYQISGGFDMQFLKNATDASWNDCTDVQTKVKQHTPDWV